MPASKGFHDLFFEVSNESRYDILILLREKPMRNTDISKALDLTSAEIRRQVSRLHAIGLIQRDLGGFYHLTPYGEMTLILFQEFHFLTDNREYFQTHTMDRVPVRFLKRIGELGESTHLSNAMDYIRHMENLIKEANEYVLLLVDQFPLNALSTIREAVERGVQFKIIEPRDRVLDPDLESMTSEETEDLNRARQTPSVEQRMLDRIDVFLFISEGKCVIALPATDGEYDYKGFTATDEASLRWSRELFQHYWDKAENRTLTPDVQVRRGPLSEPGRSLGRVVVVGQDNPAYDIQAIQDAVDRYDEVILQGYFNLGASKVIIRISVVVRGEGRENDVPSTKVYKRGWKFPFLTEEFLFLVAGAGIDVTIENIHFTDFNYVCISTSSFCDNVVIRDNRITLRTGIGRGMIYGNRGDHVIGIVCGGVEDERHTSTGRILIEGNYLDFALSYTRGGFQSRRGLETDPNYRSDLENHESYCGIGVIVNHNHGDVTIRDNVIMNMNSRGILIYDNLESAHVQILGNKIVSEVFGSYPYSSHIAGAGVFVQSSLGTPRFGSHVDIHENEIRCEKLNYCGVAVFGQSVYREGAGKLGECVVRENKIRLEDGYVGLLIRKNDMTAVYGNKISGKAYYGIHLSGSKDRDGFNLGSNDNVVEDNDLTELEVKPPDDYSDGHVDGRMFTGSGGKSITSHIWLNKFSARNTIHVKSDMTVIDEGTSNSITHDS